MKTLRFIRNICISAWESVTGGDAREFALAMWLNTKMLTGLFTLTFVLGLIGNWIGLMKYLPNGKQDSILGLGIILFLVMLFILVLVLSGWLVVVKLKEIWKKS